jgi:hypothetical protein
MSKIASSYETLYLDPLGIQLERPGASKRQNPDRSVFGYGAPVDMNDYPRIGRLSSAGSNRKPSLSINRQR